MLNKKFYGIVIFCLCKNVLTLDVPNKICQNQDLEIWLTFDGWFSIACGDYYDRYYDSSGEAPTVFFPGAVEDMYYTLVMVDPPQSPSSPTSRYWLRWLVTYIPGETLLDKENPSINGVTVVAYIGPSPSAGSDDHRYQFFLFEQNEATADEFNIIERDTFDLQEYVTKNGLGDPIAAFEFSTRNE